MSSEGQNYNYVEAMIPAASQILHLAVPIEIPQPRPAAEHHRGGYGEAVAKNEYENEQIH